MMRRSELKRNGFKSRELMQAAAPTNREQRLAERAARLMACATASPSHVSMAANDRSFAAPIERDRPLRSEAYRRLVAALPCAHCGISGYSQHAHENGYGKGKAMKVDDRRAMPLCCTRPGQEGCHTAFDQYRLLPGGREVHHAQGRAWAGQTRQQIEQSGQWPKNLPKWQEGGCNAI